MHTYYFGDGKADAGLDQKPHIGGKGASLAEITRAGLPTPPGFTIAVKCCKDFLTTNRWPNDLDDEVRERVGQIEQATGKQFGSDTNPLLFAVRSGAAESMPGMMDTILNVGRGENEHEELIAAIQSVFHSWNSERAVAYRRRHRLEQLTGTSVTVQAMFPAEVAGVLFTADPMNPSSGNMVIEAVRGLGESLVSGRATPVRYVWNTADQRIVERQLSEDAELLTKGQLAELAELGSRVEKHFKGPCDTEWAMADGRFVLLQARPIKGLPKTIESEAVNDKRDRIREETIATLRSKAAPDGTVWVRDSLAEILPAPTPMTWSIVREFVSGRGGYGAMYRDLGFDPDPALDNEGVYDLICGRPYCNLSREPKMQFRNLPFEHPFQLLKKHPEQATASQAVFNPSKAGWRFFVFFPFVCIKLIRSGMRLKKISRNLAERFRSLVIPEFVNEVNQARDNDWAQVSPADLWTELEAWIHRTLYEFARDSLKPTVLAEIANGNLTRALAQRIAAASTDTKSPTDSLLEAKAAVRALVIGARPDEDADLALGFANIASGKINRAEFLANFGHRGSEEMELARPRWREDSDALRFFETAKQIEFTNENDIEVLWSETIERAHLTASQSTILRNELQRLRTYLSLRETAKHYFMMGYDLIRRILLALDQKLKLNGEIYYMTKNDLAELIQEPGKRAAILENATNSKQNRDVELSLYVPIVLFSDDLEAIDRDPQTDETHNWQGTPLSIGIAEAPAWVVDDPATASPPAGAYILVCPTTDPAWVPLFFQAKGLVMEVGGMLSHGAIVAREFGLSAVAGIPGIHKRIKTGQILRVDGGAGTVSALS